MNPSCFYLTDMESNVSPPNYELCKHMHNNQEIPYKFKHMAPPYNEEDTDFLFDLTNNPYEDTRQNLLNNPRYASVKTELMNKLEEEYEFAKIYRTNDGFAYDAYAAIAAIITGISGPDARPLERGVTMGANMPRAFGDDRNKERFQERLPYTAAFYLTHNNTFYTMDEIGSSSSLPPASLANLADPTQPTPFTTTFSEIEKYKIQNEFLGPSIEIARNRATKSFEDGKAAILEGRQYLMNNGIDWKTLTC